MLLPFALPAKNGAGSMIQIRPAPCMARSEAGLTAEHEKALSKPTTPAVEC